VVVHPPVDGKRYKVGKRGSKLTLVNLFHRKGTATFQQIARLMPDRDFLGVEGGYGKQEKDAIKNVTYMDNTGDMKKVYSQTRILLMPSLYESYGRTAVEALVSGIPVIASPTPGLKESLGDAGIFCDAEKPAQWVQAIKRLDDPEAYKAQSKKCVERFKEIESETAKEFKAFENFLFDIYERKI
jgi:glycosyltransferase involved in cell wall biosynthesis